MDKTYYVVEVEWPAGKGLAHGYMQGSPKLYSRKCDASRTANRMTVYGPTRVIAVKLTEVSNG